MTYKIIRFAAWACLAFIIFVTVSPIGLRPHDVLPVNIDRALAFALLGLLFALAYPRDLLLCSVFVIGAAGAIELLQVLSPSRHAHFNDATVKALGGALGLVGGWLLIRTFNIVKARFN